ncbi:MBOAT family protein [Bacteroides mediterraneensis]|uniref:MBOAT family O-acyltransferase n=1 Tax=Bacteroides mediterraneensis TaxID=1841856 RepID=UPI0026F0422C|nr:MBOAT family O-acyltransferase [Bacteroides mediterraneensis]
MSFISLEFVLLLLLCFTLYHLVREKGRKWILLTASSVFIGYFNPVFLVTALVVSLFTYGAAIRVERACEKERGSRLIYWSSISCLVLCWIGFRYAHQLTGNSGIGFPLGMSFYTFQAIGYLTEVYWQEEKAERNLMDFLLYMLLFMKFLSGPIERSADLLPQVRRLSPASYSMMTYGLKLIVVGLVKKLVLADHIAPYIDGVFDSMHTASGVQLLMACLLYPIELYADFSGYTDMAIGTGMLFGLKLSPNFARPFAAQTTAEFWRRWHISLSSWVRDYLFLPLSSVTRRWGQGGVAVSLLVTFLALGIWHGAGWTFAVYGLIQGLVIVWELRTEKIRSKVRKQIGERLFATLSVVRTYLIFAVSLVFFKAQSVSEAFYFLRNISFQTHARWKEINIGMSDHICIVAGSAFLLILLYDFFMSKSDLLLRFENQPALVRWTVYYLIVFAVFAYGKFGTENFIYLQF